MDRCLKIYISLLILTLVTVILFPWNASAAVWPTTHASWLDKVGEGTQDTWEDRYSQWVRENLNEYFFTNPKSPGYGIKTVCDKAVYVIRLIFAAQNGLPYIVSTRNGGYISNETSNLSYRQFISYVLSSVSLETLSRDTYPVAVDPRYIRPGTVSLYKGAHSLTVHNVLSTGEVERLSVTEPLQVWQMDVITDITTAPKGSVSHPDDGFRLWRHYEKRYPISPEPGYSTEQFSLETSDGDAWGFQIEDRLGDAVIEAKVESTIMNAYTQAVQRVNLVQQALDEKAALRGGCLSRGSYLARSTPGKDENIKSRFKKLDRYLKAYPTPEVMGMRDKLFARAEIHYDLKDSSKYIMLDDLKAALEKVIVPSDPDRKVMVSSDPNDSLERRWGLPDPNPSQGCPTYETNHR